MRAKEGEEQCISTSVTVGKMTQNKTDSETPSVLSTLKSSISSLLEGQASSSVRDVERTQKKPGSRVALSFQRRTSVMIALDFLRGCLFLLCLIF